MKLSELHLGRRYLPLFGRLSLWLMLLMAVLLTFQLDDKLFVGIRVGAVTVAGLLPESVRSNPHLYFPLWCIFIVCAVLWASNLLLPFSSWGTTLSFFAYVSLFLDNIPYPLHECHLTTIIMFVYCAWYHFYWRDIRDATREGRFWTTPLYPNWVYVACVFTLCWAYFLPGLSKLLEGEGFKWADGLTLQMWILARGQHEGWLGAWVVNHRTYAIFLQLVGVGFELVFPLAFFLPRLRIPLALLTTGFHLANIFLLDVDFVANTIILWTFFLLWPLFDRYYDAIWARFNRLVLGNEDVPPSTPEAAVVNAAEAPL